MPITHHIPPGVEIVLRACKVITERLQWGNNSVTEGFQDIRYKGSATKDDMNAVLRSLGIFPGNVVMMHSDAGAVARLGWTPSEMIDHLLEYLGPLGTLAMPSHPHLQDCDARRIFDVRRSYSTVGLLTEVFRRRKETLRSEYPFAAAAAQGALARQMLSAHRDSYAPHDEYSPYGRLAALNGKVLILGCALDRMTIIHVAEDTLRDAIAIPGFYQTEVIWIRNDEGEFPLETHRRAPWLWWYLAKFQWTAQMHDQGLVRKALLMGMPFLAVDATATVAWMQEQVRRGKTIYPLAKWNRIFRLRGPDL